MNYSASAGRGLFLAVSSVHNCSLLNFCCMNKTDQYRWGLYLFLGIISVLIGIFALILPEITFATLVILFAAYMLVDGVFFIAAAIERSTNRGWYIFIGIVSILAGLFAIINPFAAGLALVYLFGIWALIAGIAAIAMAISLRKRIRGEGWYIAAGVITAVFAVLILLNPAAGAITLALLFGINALVRGILMISLAMRLRRRRRAGGIREVIA